MSKNLLYMLSVHLKAQTILMARQFLSQPFQSKAKASPACCLFSRKLCPSDSLTDIISRESNGAITACVLRVLKLIARGTESADLSGRAV